MQNGRVNTTQDANYALYNLFQNGNNQMSEFSREAIIGIHTTTPLNDLFFSEKNVKALQQGIHNVVANKSQGEFLIGSQSEVELQVVMRAIYLKEAQHHDYGIIEQVRELNQKVIDYCVPRILEEVRMFKYYKKDVSQLPVPLARGEFSSSKGLRVLESKEF